MGLSIVSQPSGINYINYCAVWTVNIDGTVDETVDERGVYRLMSTDGPVTDWSALPPVGNLPLDFSKEIAAALETPLPDFSDAQDVSSMKKKFWLEYGDISFDKMNCTKTENLGNQSAQVDFVNGKLNGGQSGNFELFTMRPDYMEVPRYWYFDYIYSTAGSASFAIKLCDGSTVNTSTGGAGEITAFGVGTVNSPVQPYIEQVVYYDVTLGGRTYRFKILEGEIRALSDWYGNFTPLRSQSRVSLIAFLEPSGGYSVMPVEYLQNTQQDIQYQEICVYRDQCQAEPYRAARLGQTIYGKTTKARFSFSVRSPRTQQFGLWVQYFAASQHYMVLYRDDTSAFYWANFIVDSVSEGYNHNRDDIIISGYMAQGLNPQES